ncbi:MAG: DUF6089 family protein, partial [Ginsengibacter sp.]
MPYNNIKQMAIFAIFMSLFLPVFSQKTQKYNDVAPFSGTSPFRKFSIGINAGVLSPSVLIGGSDDFAHPQYTLGYGANVHYQINHYLALQADFLSGKLKGDQNDKFGAGRPVASFKTNLQWAASLSGVFTAGNINWLSSKNKVIPYVSAGLGFMGYKTKIVNAGTTNEIDYTDSLSPKNPRFIPIAVGLKINLTSLLNLDIGYKMNFVDADNLDGLPYWHESINFRSRVHKDKFSYGFVGLEFALGNKAKPQMLFDNPAARVNHFLQTQVDTVKNNMQQLSQDSDGDGVPDKFDKEPNSPAGCPVDTHGVTKDTDGDGVPDCKDKELITPTQCQPVDADGVGRCPDPECCKNMTAALDTNKCHIGELPSISFRGKSGGLSNDAKAMLATVASELKNNAECSIIITGYPAA